MDETASWRALCDLPLAQAAPDMAALLRRQERLNREAINLVASENYCPRATLQAEASVLVNKNASGYPPRTAFGGGAVMDEIEALAISRARRLFGAEHANVQALSSTIANVAVLRGLLRAGDRILAFDRASGGHSSHGSARHVSGQDYVVESFGVDPDSGHIDYEAVRAHVRAFRPRMIVAGSSAYPRAIDFAALAAIAGETGALTLADIAHVSGFVIAGLLDNPVQCCDVVTTSTHKTFCGPRTGGLILSRAIHARAIDAALAPGLQAAPGGHIIAARAVLFDLVARPAFARLMRAVLEDAGVLAQELARHGVPLYAGGTDTHMVVVDLRAKPWTQAGVNAWLEAHGIVANTATLPRRPADACALGLRLGSTPMTIRGLDRDGYVRVARALAALLAAGPGAAPDPGLRDAMTQLARAHPVPEVPLEG